MSGISEISNESQVVRMGMYIKEKLLKYELRVMSQRIGEIKSETLDEVDSTVRTLS